MHAARSRRTEWGGNLFGDFDQGGGQVLEGNVAPVPPIPGMYPNPHGGPDTVVGDGPRASFGNGFRASFDDGCGAPISNGFGRPYAARSPLFQRPVVFEPAPMLGRPPMSMEEIGWEFGPPGRFAREDRSSFEVHLHLGTVMTTFSPVGMRPLSPSSLTTASHHEKTFWRRIRTLWGGWLRRKSINVCR